MNTFPFFNFFEFKNKETGKAIEKAISQNEGILSEKMGEYLFYSHVKRKADLFLKARDILNQFRETNKLCLSDLMGVIHLALSDIDSEAKKAGDKYMELHKKK